MISGLLWLLVGLVYVDGLTREREPLVSHMVNVRLRPLDTAHSELGAALDFGIARRVALGPSLLVYRDNSRKQDENLVEVGGTATVFITAPRYESGLYLRGGFHFLPINWDALIYNGQREREFETLNLTLGWHWPIKRTRLNVATGLGCDFYKVRSGGSRRNFDVELSLGWLL